VLFELLEFTNELNRLLLTKNLLVSHHFAAVSNLVLLVLVSYLHVTLELLSLIANLFIELVPNIVELWKVFQTLASLFISGQNAME
jgi:hypothetical protein